MRYNSEKFKGENIRSKRMDKQKEKRLQERYLFRADSEIQETKEPKRKIEENGFKKEIKHNNNKNPERQKRGYGILISNARKAEGILNYIQELIEEDIESEELKNKAAEAQSIVNEIKKSREWDEQEKLLQRLNKTYYIILNKLSKARETQKFTDEDAEKMIKIVGGEDVFEREDDEMQRRRIKRAEQEIDKYFIQGTTEQKKPYKETEKERAGKAQKIIDGTESDIEKVERELTEFKEEGLTAPRELPPEVDNFIQQVIDGYRSGRIKIKKIENLGSELRRRMPTKKGYNLQDRDAAVEKLFSMLESQEEEAKIKSKAKKIKPGIKLSAGDEPFFTLPENKGLYEKEYDEILKRKKELEDVKIEELKERYLALWGERSKILGESGTDRTERFRNVEREIGELDKQFAKLGIKIELFKWIGEKEEEAKRVGEEEKKEEVEEIKEEPAIGKSVEEVPRKDEREIIEELEQMPQKEKIKLSKGLANLGLYAEYRKNSFFSDILNKFAKPFAKKDKHIAEQGTLARFLTSMAKNYEKDAERAENKLRQKGRKGWANYRYIASNVSMYGRILADTVGWTAASPFKYVMALTMFFDRGAQAAKEARLKNKKVMGKTRIDDIDKAEEEAWKIYELARNQGKNQITGEDLVKAYRENLPADLLHRLKNRVNADQAHNIIGNIIAKDIGRSVKKIEMKLDNIEKNKKLSEEERIIKKEKILEKYNRFLNDLDGMVSKYGAFDGLALGAKYTETGAKAVIAGLTVESLYLLTQNLPKLYNDLHNLYNSISGEHEIIGKGAEVGVKRPVMPAERADGSAKTSSAELEKIKENIAREAMLRKEKFNLAAIHDKEGIEHVIRRQLEAEPENYGYKGDASDKVTVHKWSGGEAHRAAIKAGYVNPETGEEIRVGAKGIDKAAYVLEKDARGGTRIHEYYKGEDGSFKSQEVHELAENFKGAEFEGADREFYEYEHKGGTEKGVSEAVEAARGAAQDGFSEDEINKLSHLASHENNLEQAAESIKMVEGAGISYKDSYEYFYQLKNLSGEPGRMEGIVEILKHHDYKSGLSKIFGITITEKNFEVKGGVYRIKDFKPGFDYIVKIDGGEIKFGVDGPLGQWNWGARGRTWRAFADADLTNENIEKAKSEVENMLNIFKKRR